MRICDWSSTCALPISWVTDDSAAIFAAAEIEVVIDATGHPPAGIRHARLARQSGKHMVMVNVEADALAGPLLAAEAAEAGVASSLAPGAAPALIAQMVGWARACRCSHLRPGPSPHNRASPNLNPPP